MKITETEFKEPTSDLLSSEDIQPEKPVSEREKLKSMTRKDRRWYIGEYYKFHIIGVILAIVLVYNVGMAMYRGSFDTAFYCMILNSRSESELNTAPIEQGFAEYLGLGEKELITTEASFISYEETANELSYASMAKISALVAAKDLDVIIGDLDVLKHYASLDGFLDFETEISADILALIPDDRLVYTEGSDDVLRPYGIDLEGTEFAMESKLGQDPPILGIISNSTRKDNSVALLRYIFAP